MTLQEQIRRASWRYGREAQIQQADRELGHAHLDLSRIFNPVSLTAQAEIASQVYERLIAARKLLGVRSDVERDL